MKRLFTLLIIMVVAITGFATEIAYVDAMEVFQNVDKYKQQFDELTSFFQDTQSGIDAKKAKIEGELQTLQEQAELMDKAKKDAKTKELQGQYEALVQEFQGAQQELNQKQQIIYESFQRELAVAVQSVADDLGYDMVVLKEAVIYSGSGNDITSDVIRAMNGKKKSKKK